MFPIVPITCGEDEFECVETGRCLPDGVKCNGFADCFDESDESLEVGCGEYTLLFNVLVLMYCIYSN